MAKSKKTKRQKVLADLHRQLQLTKQQGETISPATPTVKETNRTAYSLPKTPIKTVNSPILYTYLLPDLRKTGITTVSIIIIQLILFFLITQHMLPYFANQ